MKKCILIPLYSLFILLFACSENVDEGDTIVTNQPASLEWHGSPAVDGAGMLLVTNDDNRYGAPGVPEDYPDLFISDTTYAVDVITTYRITGEITSRGWGETFQEIEILKLKAR